MSWIKLNRVIFFLLILLSAMIPCFAQEVSFTAQINSQKVGTDDYFQLTYSIHNANNVGEFTPPSFKGFQIIGSPSQSSSSQMSNINGKITRSHTYNINFILKAEKEGNYTIAPASVEVDGKVLKSNTVSVEIVKGSLAQRQQHHDPFSGFWGRRQSAPQQNQNQNRQEITESIDKSELDKHVFIKVDVDKKDVYIGEQITASYKLYTSLPMSVSLSQLPSLNGFWSEDFAIPKVPKPTEETINGKKYQVFLLKKSALFPQQSGSLILDEAKAEGVVRILRRVQGRHPFADDPFFSFFMDDPFFNNEVFSRHSFEDVPVKLSSKPTVINVKPLPFEGKTENFTGGVGKFELNANLDKSEITTDEAATLTLTINGSGNFKLIGNPAVKFPEALGVYDPEITDTILSRNPAISGKKIFKYNINPQEPGSYNFGPIEFSYYDIASKSYKTLTTGFFKLEVTPGANYSQNKTKSIITASGDINGLFLNVPNWQNNSGYWVNSGFYWTLYLLPVVIFAFLYFRKKQNDYYKNNTALLKNKRANKIAWRRLATARKLMGSANHKAFYEEISKAIWLYLSDKLSIPISELSKENIVSELIARQIDSKDIAQIQHLISECEIALYSPVGGNAQKQKSLDDAVMIISGLENGLKQKRHNRHSTAGVTSVILIVCLSFGFFSIWASDKNGQMEIANDLYNKKQYESALNHYQQLINEGHQSVELFYNAGNTYYKLHKIGLSVLYYQKALRLAPGNKMITENLELAQQKINRQLPKARTLFLVEWWQSLVLLFSPNGWAVMAFVFFTGVLAILYLLFTQNSLLSNKGRWLSLAGALFLLSTILAFFSASNYKPGRLAVVIADTTTVVEQPNESAKQIAIAPEGATLLIIEDKSNYILIELPNGRRGWIKQSDIEKV